MSGLFIILIAKTVRGLLRVFGFGSGATWPGEIALRLDPSFLGRFNFDNKSVVYILGTNGKTTTAKLLQSILATAGKKVLVNASGANLDNGIISALIADTDWRGKLKSDVFVFEIDEASLPRVSQFLRPRAIVLLNLFRDQLDRYGEVDQVAEMWLRTLKNIGQGVAVVGNADDPQLVYITKRLKTQVEYFGLNDPKSYLPQMQHATDSTYCPVCGERLVYKGVYFSHLGDWSCGSCGRRHPQKFFSDQSYHSPIPGTYNRYNTLAAALVGQILQISKDQIVAGLQQFRPAFGRLETVKISDKTVNILLSKNPTGFNESLRTALELGGRNFLLVLNDRIPDGQDVSWIWDVDFDGLTAGKLNITVSGDRTYDLALRLKYAGLDEKSLTIAEDLSKAVKKSLELTAKDEKLYVLPTYSAMLEVRKILTGRGIL